MFGIGPVEFAVVLVLALLIMGPKKLPELARTLGRGMAELRRASNELRRSIDMDLPDHKIEPPPGPAQAGLRADEERRGEDLSTKPHAEEDEAGGEEPDSSGEGGSEAGEEGEEEEEDGPVPVAPPREMSAIAPDEASEGTDEAGHGDGSDESVPVDTGPPRKATPPNPDATGG